MSRRIPQAFIHELIARADLLDVIGGRVTLKRAGGSYKGLCPFHDEKTPSFTVNPDKGFYHCFGCGAHGNAIDFVIAYENRSFPEAVEALADMLHLEIPLESRDEQLPENDGLFAMLREADQIYRRSLREHPAAIAYLKNRGIDGGTAAKFGLGYAPDAWDTLVRTLGAGTRGLETLVEAGLVKVNEQGRRYDTFRDRIMFPIRDSRGRVIGFGGRLLGPGEPKYMNSPETPVFHKRQALYGIYEARQRPGRPAEILVVEGYLDVAALAQFGVEPAMATLGTATTGEHIRQLTRLSNRVVFCFDGDRAGRAAAWRAAEAALPFGGGNVEIKFLLLPEGEDPDSFVRSRGADAFRGALTESLPLSAFLLHELRSQVELASSDGRGKLIALARPLLARLPGGVYQELLTAELAELIGMSPDRFRAILDPEPVAGRPAGVRRRASADRSRTMMRKLITLIVHYPRAAGRLAPVDGLEDVDAPGAALLRRLLEMTAKDPQLMSAQLIEAFRDDPEGRHLQRLAAEVPLDDELSAASVLADGLANLVATQHKLAAAAAVKRGTAGSSAEGGHEM